MDNFSYNERYQFNEAWFDPMIPLWEQVFNTPSSFGYSPSNILEIGSYEGRATVWLCENVLTDKKTQYNYDVVDTFGGTLEETGMEKTAKNFETDNDFIYNNFTHNISFFPNINFNVYREFSNSQLPKLLKEGKKYNFIYIDASHRADDTFVDAYYAHLMLEPEGILIFDDLGWKDPNAPHPVNSPELGIRMFLSCYSEEYKPLFQGYQIGLIKKQKNG